jgi:hypothetical protein
MAGLASPLNTLHGALGPTLQRRGRFFGDVSSHLIVDGQAVDFDAEWIARPRGTGLIVTRADAGDVTLYTVDAAIVSAGAALGPGSRWPVHETHGTGPTARLCGSGGGDDVVGWASRCGGVQAVQDV